MVHGGSEMGQHEDRHSSSTRHAVGACTRSSTSAAQPGGACLPDHVAAC